MKMSVALPGLLASAVLVAPPPSWAQGQSQMRLDRTTVTVTIDASGNVTGNDPLKLYVSHYDSGPFCSKAGFANVQLEDIPPQFTSAFTGPNTVDWMSFPAHPPYNIDLKQGQRLCNVNEGDVTPSPFLLPPLTLAPAATPYAGSQAHSASNICDFIRRPGSYTKQYRVRTWWDDNFYADEDFTMTIVCLAPRMTATVSAPVSLQGDSSGKVTGNAQVTIVPLREGAPPCPYEDSVWAYSYNVFQNVGQQTVAVTGTKALFGRLVRRSDGGCPSNESLSGSAVALTDVDFCTHPVNAGKTVSAIRPVDVFFCKTVDDCSGTASDQDAVVRANITVSAACAAAPASAQPQIPKTNNNGVLTSTQVQVNPAVSGPDVATKGGAVAVPKPADEIEIPATKQH